jgi:hypothetical protein
MKTAVGNKAFGFCDRTGFRYPLKDLREQYINRKPTGLMVGKDVLDIDQEQLRLGEVDANDPQTLDNPRPDTTLRESRAMASWNPVGYGNLDMSGIVGRVTVRID